ncbi:hypothetical protein HDV62DRAFT_57709 [Trichoderma sp. SZMC 28011]
MKNLLSLLILSGPAAAATTPLLENTQGASTWWEENGRVMIQVGSLWRHAIPNDAEHLETTKRAGSCSVTGQIIDANGSIVQQSTVQTNSNTATCQTDLFVCSGGNCVTTNHFCDANVDCSDGSDEIQCNVYSDTACGNFVAGVQGNPPGCIRDTPSINSWLCFNST